MFQEKESFRLFHSRNTWRGLLPGARSANRNSNEPLQLSSRPVLFMQMTRDDPFIYLHRLFSRLLFSKTCEQINLNQSHRCENVFQKFLELAQNVSTRERRKSYYRCDERGGSFPSGRNTVKVTRKCVKVYRPREAPFKNASGPFMRQRLCSNSGHHRATIEALAIKSSRGTRSVYTDRFEYVALQSRMCKRGGCGREQRANDDFHFENRTRRIRARICIYSCAILDFGRSLNGKRGSAFNSN